MEEDKLERKRERIAFISTTTLERRNRGRRLLLYVFVWVLGDRRWKKTNTKKEYKLSLHNRVLFTFLAFFTSFFFRFFSCDGLLGSRGVLLINTHTPIHSFAFE